MTSLATRIYYARTRTSSITPGVPWPLTFHVLLAMIAYAFTESVNLRMEHQKADPLWLSIQGWIPTIAASLATVCSAMFDARLYHKRVMTWLIRTGVYALAAVYAFSITRD